MSRSLGDIPVPWLPAEVSWRPTDSPVGVHVEWFRSAGRRFDVAGLTDWWPDASTLYLKVRTRTGEWYILRWDQRRDEWSARFHARSSA